MSNEKKTISNEMFESIKTINNVSRSGTLWGKLFAMKEMRIYLQDEEMKIKKQIKELEIVKKDF